MKVSYYYLIAGLPDIYPAMDNPQIDFDQTFDLIQRNLLKEDEKLFRYLIYPHDMQNLLSILFEEYQDLPLRPFKKPALLDIEELKGYKFSKGNFPDFMSDFLAENEDRFSSMSMRAMEDALWEKFYAEIARLNHSFLIDYFAFNRALKGVIAAFQFNAYGFLSPPNIPDAERLTGQIGPDKSPTASLSKDYPYLEELIKALSANKPETIERLIDRILWEFLEERYQGVFSGEEVLAYTLKLQITQRWLIIDSQKGKARFDKLHRHIKNNVRSPKTPVI